MKLFIERDELYPYYFVVAPSRFYGDEDEVEVDDAMARRWKSGMRAFAKIQGEMRDALAPKIKPKGGTE